MKTTRSYRFYIFYLLYLCGLLLWTGCGFTTEDAEDAELTKNIEQSASDTRLQSIVAPINGFPNYAERVVLYLTNRARTEPTAFNADEPYPPSAPLQYDLSLSHAARWQARHIIQDSCWCDDHSSCCTIGQTENGIECLDASNQCGATNAAERVAFFSPDFSGENMAQGHPTPAAAINGWIHSSGHWQNMNSTTHNLLGTGEYQRGWVQVFGRNNDTIPVIMDGIHFADGSAHTFGITYYQPGTGGPQTAMVIINGQCHNLELAYGQPDHGAFELTNTLQTGCNRYYFHFTDGEGTDHIFPPYGSFAVASGDTDQCEFFSENKPADTCSPSGQSCHTGDTRHCYTGPFGTRDVGICTAGVERCIGGQWSGECRNQILPADEEICDNGLDDTCTGIADDGCHNTTQPPVDNDPSTAPTDDTDSQHEGELNPQSAKGDDGSSGCNIAPTRHKNTPIPAIVLALSMTAIFAFRWQKLRHYR